MRPKALARTLAQVSPLRKANPPQPSGLPSNRSGLRPGSSPKIPNHHLLGFTIIEAMVAVWLGAIMLTALYAGFTCGYGGIKLAREDLRATQVLLKSMESIRLYTFDQLTNSTYAPLSTDYYDPTDQASGAGGTTYNVTFTAATSTNIPSVYSNDMLLVTVTVNWTNACGPNYTNSLVHSRSMQTYVARNGIQSYVSTGQ